MLWDNVFRMRNLRIFQQIWYLQIQLEQIMTKELKQASENKTKVFIVTLTAWNALILLLVSYSLISTHVCSSCKWEVLFQWLHRDHFLVFAFFPGFCFPFSFPFFSFFVAARLFSVNRGPIPFLVINPCHRFLISKRENSLVTLRKRVKANSCVEQYHCWLFLMQKAWHTMVSKATLILHSTTLFAAWLTATWLLLLCYFFKRNSLPGRTLTLQSSRPSEWEMTMSTHF